MAQAELLLQLRRRGGEVGGRQHLAGPNRDRRPAAQDLLLQRRREAARRLAEPALEEFDHRLGERQVAGRVQHHLRRQVVGQHEERHVADHLRRRRDLDDVAEHAVDRCVHLADFRPAVADAERLGLLIQIRVLAAGHFVQINLGAGRLLPRLERGVFGPDAFPIVRRLLEGVEVQAGVAVGVAHRLGQGVEARLARLPGHRGERAIDHVHPLLGRGQVRRELAAGRVVGVEVDRQPHRLAERLDELLRRVRLEQAGHVLDGEDVRPELFQLLGERDEVVEVVLGPLRVEDVAGVADGRLGDAAGFADGLDPQPQVRHPVERVEDSEHVDAGLGRLPDERLDDVVRVVGVADGVGRPQQHLEQHVRDLLAEPGEPVPRRLLEEAHGRVERGPAPHFEREQIGVDARRIGVRCGACRPCASASRTATGGRRAWSCPSPATSARPGATRRTSPRRVPSTCRASLGGFRRPRCGPTANARPRGAAAPAAARASPRRAR